MNAISIEDVYDILNGLDQFFTKGWYSFDDGGNLAVEKVKQYDD